MKAPSDVLKRCIPLLLMLCISTSLYSQSLEFEDKAVPIVPTQPPSSCYEPKLTVTPGIANMVFGEKKQFRATVITDFPMTEGAQVVCPETAEKSSKMQLNANILPIKSVVKWTTNDAALATVDSMGYVEVTGHEGTVFVTAKMNYDGRTLVDSARITITVEEELQLTIEPRIVKFTTEGEQVRLQAMLNGRPTNNVVWTSSRPEDVSVSNGGEQLSGLVTANVDLGSAIITAHLNVDVLHEPAMINAMVVNQQNNVVDIPKQNIISLSFDLEAAAQDSHSGLPSAEMVIAPVYSRDTLPFAVGDVVTNPEYGGIFVEQIEFTTGGIFLHGRQPVLTEVFYNLDVTFGDQDYALFFDLYKEKSGMSVIDRAMAKAIEEQSPSPMLSSAFASDCERLMRFDWGADPYFQTEFKVDRGSVKLMRLMTGLFLAPTLTADSKIEAAVECAWTLVPPTTVPILGAFPSAGGIVTLVPHAYSNLELEVALSFLHQAPSLEPPTFSATTGVRSVFEMNGDTGESFGTLEPQPVDSVVSLNLFSGDNSFTADINFGVTLGFVWSVIPGYPAVPFKLDYTDIAGLNIYAPEYKVALGRRLEVPDEMLLPQSFPEYRGPIGNDYTQFTAKPIKSIELGGIIDRVATYFGFEELRIKPSYEVEMLPTVTTPWPKFETFSAAVDTVYIGGYPRGHERYINYPGEVEITMPVGNMSGWGGSGRGWSKKELWAKWQDDSVFSQLRTDIEDDVYLYRPQANDVGDMTIRAHLDYQILGFPLDIAEIKPSVSEEISLTVKAKPQLEIQPVGWNLNLIPGGSSPLAFDVMNTGSEAVQFHFESNAEEISVPPSTFTIQPGETLNNFNVFVQCKNESYAKEAIGYLVNAAQGERTAFTVYLRCALFDVAPNPVSMSATVNKWVSKVVTVRNITQNDASVTVSSSGVSVFPTETIVPATDNTDFTFNYKCGSSPSKNTYSVTFKAGGYAQPVYVNTECKDAGSSTGDPHLFSFDRYKFDFQAMGEFVLSRWQGAGNSFEIQARQAPFGGSSKVTVNKAIAFNVHGDRLSIYTREQEPEGAAVMLGDSPLMLVDGESYVLPSSSSILSRHGEVYNVEWQNGAHARVVRHNGHLALSATPPASSAGELVGVLGNYNDIANDDFKLRDGTVLPFPPQEVDFYDCREGKRCFAYHSQLGWLIRSPQESLFSYTLGRGPLDYAPAENEQFPLDVFTLADYGAEQVASAELTCRDQGVTTQALLDSCIMDLLITGDSSFAKVQAELEVSSEGSAPNPGTTPVSCKQLLEAGTTESGSYEIDPDGDGPLGLVTVYCDMGSSGGGWTFKPIYNGAVTKNLGDSDSCTQLGLQLFAPRSQQEYNIGRSFAARLGPVNMGPLGIYNPESGNAVAAQGRPMNSVDLNNAAERGWVSSAGGEWWISGRTDIGEPSGDYVAGCWLDVIYDNEGWVNGYNDFDGDGAPTCVFEHRDYMCVHPHNLLITPAPES